MSNLYNIIESLCSERGINITEMCREAGISRGNLSDLKKGRQSGLSAANMSKIAQYFDVSIEYLLGVPAKKEPTSQEDELLKEFIDLFQKLSPEDQKREIAYLRERAASKDM